MYRSYSIPILRGYDHRNRDRSNNKNDNHLPSTSRDNTQDDDALVSEIISETMGSETLGSDIPSRNDIYVKQDDDLKEVKIEEDFLVHEAYSRLKEETDNLQESSTLDNFIAEQHSRMIRNDHIKWATLEFDGIMFAPDYVPLGTRMKYDGTPITLSTEAEEVASFYAALLETHHVKNPVFRENFFNDWKEVLKKDPKNPEITDFSKCDFKPIWHKLNHMKTSKDQAEIESKERALYRHVTVDGQKRELKCCRVDYPGLYISSYVHKHLNGRVRKRVLPEDVTINLGENATVPRPPNGHTWGAIVHNHKASWVARWNDNVKFRKVYIRWKT